jgi:hypothetical protein
VAGVIFLLNRGGDAGRTKVSQATTLTVAKDNPESVFPRIIWGRLDNFKNPIVLEPVISWEEETKPSLILKVSPDGRSNQPSARVKLIQRTTTPVVLEIRYTVPQEIVETLLANGALKDKTDGVTVLIGTVGLIYNQSTLLSLDPVRIADQRKWFTYYLPLPVGTEEIHFSIIGPPPNYNVFWDSWAMYLPQLRVAPAKAALTSPAPSPSESNP